ncbi:hypothetical protein ACKKBF_B13980 [Auxenochlorella protothecoides x Auxenochlorella symbiontica]
MASFALATTGASLAFTRVLRPQSLHRVALARPAAVRTKALPNPRRALSVTTRAMSGDLVATLKEKNKKNPVVVYSKTYCPCEAGGVLMWMLRPFSLTKSTCMTSLPDVPLLSTDGQTVRR